MSNAVANFGPGSIARAAQARRSPAFSAQVAHAHQPLPSRPTRQPGPTSQAPARKHRRPPTTSGFGPLVPDPKVTSNPFKPLDQPRCPWAAALPTLHLTTHQLAELDARCRDWTAKIEGPDQIDLWSRLVMNQPFDPLTESASVLALDEWLLIDAPWPGDAPPVLKLAALAFKDGHHEVARALRAMADAQLEIFKVVGHTEDGCLQVTQRVFSNPWPEVITVRPPEDSGPLPAVGQGIGARLLPDVGGGLRFSDAWLRYPEPPIFFAPDRRTAAPMLVNFWLGALADLSQPDTSLQPQPVATWRPRVPAKLGSRPGRRSKRKACHR